jgi:hypothetical protein
MQTTPRNEKNPNPNWRIATNRKSVNRTSCENDAVSGDGGIGFEKTRRNGFGRCMKKNDFDFSYEGIDYGCDSYFRRGARGCVQSHRVGLDPPDSVLGGAVLVATPRGNHCGSGNADHHPDGEGDSPDGSFLRNRVVGDRYSDEVAEDDDDLQGFWIAPSCDPVEGAPSDSPVHPSSSRWTFDGF